MDHGGGDMKNYERPDPCEEQHERERKEYKSHKNDSLVGDDSTLIADSPALGA